MIDNVDMEKAKKIKIGDRGFVKEIIIVLIALVVLKYYFQFDLVLYGEQYFGNLVSWIKSWF
jgi:hypothetical protein